MMKNTLMSWHIRKLLFIVFIFLAAAPVMWLLLMYPGTPESDSGLKVVAVIVLSIGSYLFMKFGYCCPHCKKIIDLRLPIHDNTKCPHCGEDLVEW